MNKKRVCIITIVVSLIVILVFCVGAFIFKQTHREKNDPQENNPINTVTEISLGENVWVNSLTKINIKNTNDYFEITEKVKWETPEHSKGTTISFSVFVPYTFVVNGVSYNGGYQLGDSSWNQKPEGLPYNLKVVNLTKDGKLQIIVTK